MPVDYLVNGAYGPAAVSYDVGGVAPFSLLGNAFRWPGLGSPTGPYNPGPFPWPIYPRPLPYAPASFGGPVSPFGGVSPFDVGVGAPLGGVGAAGGPDVETQATNDFLGGASSGAITKLYGYLKDNSAQYSQLSQCIPLVSRAAESFRVRDFTQAFQQAFQAYRYIAYLRASQPDMPRL